MSRFANNTEQTANKGPAGPLADKNHRIVSLQNRFQNGYLTDLTFAPASTDYTRQPLIIKVLRLPTGFQYITDAKLYNAALINLVETLMQSWAGFNRTLSVSVAETQIGRSNEVFQTPTRVSRARSNITSTVVEKDGMPVIRFLENITRYFIGDPDVGHPLISSMSAKQVPDLLADMYSMDIIAYEPDKTFQFVNDAYLVTNMYLQNEIGERTGTRELQADRETVTYNLTWTGTQKVGFAVDQLAQAIMSSGAILNTKIDPGMQKTFIGLTDAGVKAVKTGFTDQILELKKNMVKP